MTRYHSFREGMKGQSMGIESDQAVAIFSTIELEGWVIHPMHYISLLTPALNRQAC
uniref:Uncharacterized protein n=1 Tax=Picea glauca TaxID=3330 RepID=A0A101LZG0_PICGL|nr:hypothetical protein ABT39_MTgene5088 [Picea glauca]QHR87718.1 hypothetical protein Q903MT_gene1730 [Picea sitchensis]